MWTGFQFWAQLSASNSLSGAFFAEYFRQTQTNCGSFGLHLSETVLIRALCLSVCHFPLNFRATAGSLRARTVQEVPAAILTFEQAEDELLQLLNGAVRLSHVTNDWSHFLGFLVAFSVLRHVGTPRVPQRRNVVIVEKDGKAVIAVRVAGGVQAGVGTCCEGQRLSAALHIDPGSHRIHSQRLRLPPLYFFLLCSKPLREDEALDPFPLAEQVPLQFSQLIECAQHSVVPVTHELREAVSPRDGCLATFVLRTARLEKGPLSTE